MRSFAVAAGLMCGVSVAAAGPDIRKEGAFGFPQKDATVLCDTPALRVSEWSDAEYLYVQAVVWKDGDGSLGETEDGRAIGDTSALVVDVDGDGKATAKVDRDYSLDPWPQLKGLHYSVVMGPNSSSGLTADSKGRGAIMYVEEEPGVKVRVDSYLIPLAEIKRKPGDTIKVAFWAKSPTPDLIVNSVGFESGKKYYSHHLPRKDYHEVKLADRPATADVQKVPEGRETIKLEQPAKAMPEAGSRPPEVKAGAWLNWKGEMAPSLESLKGKVVVVEFWATWCGPCVAGIPHLNEVHDAHAKDGLVILSMTDQKKEHIEEFMKDKPMRYAVGVKSNAVEEYGVKGIPHAFVVGRDGVLLWHGHPQEPEFETKIEQALKAK